MRADKKQILSRSADQGLPGQAGAQAAMRADGRGYLLKGGDQAETQCPWLAGECQDGAMLGCPPGCPLVARSTGGQGRSGTADGAQALSCRSAGCPATGAATGRRLVVVFEDEADLALLPHVGYSWQLVDQPASVPTPGQNEKVALCGSLSLEGELVITEALRKTARLLSRHLDQVVARFSPAVLVVIWDNIGIHHAKLTAAWLAAHPQVHPVHLPRYSPNENAQERVWGWLRAQVCRNRAFPTWPPSVPPHAPFSRRARPTSCAVAAHRRGS